MAAFTRCQALPTRHRRSMPHWLEAPLHSVMAIGPSNDVENLRRGDLCGVSREPIAALRTARGDDQAGALQALQDLAHRRAAEARALSELRGGTMPSRLLR